MRISTIFAAPAHYEGVSVTDAKRQLRIHETDTTFDVEIGRLITSGTQWVERRLGISIITQTRLQVQDRFYPVHYRHREYRRSRFAIDLPFAPIQSVTEVKYIDTNGVLQTLTQGTDYYTAGIMTPTAGAQDIARGRVLPVNSWPATKYVDEAVKIKYVCGYGDDATFVPEPIKDVILRYVSFFFEERKDETTGPGVTIAKFEMNIERLMSTYERYTHVDVDEW